MLRRGGGLARPGAMIRPMGAPAAGLLEAEYLEAAAQADAQEAEEDKEFFESTQ